MAFKKAVKHQAKLRLALCGLAGSGKTYSALAIANEISTQMREQGHGDGRIAVIDSERGSASLYADRFSFDVSELESFSPLAYVEKIKEAEREGYDIIVADSISHAWAGKDGALEQKGEVEDRGKANSWTAWRTITPKHNAMVDAMLQCRAHFIATMRVKMEHVQETEGGHTTIKKVGLASVQREGMDYEFTIVGDIDQSHTMKISKTRAAGIEMGELFERPGEDFARRVYGWLMAGTAPIPESESSNNEFVAYVSAIEAATSLDELTVAIRAQGRPEKGTKEYDMALSMYSAVRGRLSPQHGE